MSRVLLVGENNTQYSDPVFDLYPYPRYRSGGRLCSILGMTPREYLRRFRRLNLLNGSRWTLPAARDSARRVLDDPGARCLILLGVRVATAFGLPSEPFLTYDLGTVLAIVLPHPSGRCQVWNDPTAAPRARALVLKALGSAG